MQDGGKEGMSTVRKIAAAAALGVAVPAAVGIAKRMLGNGDRREEPESGSSRSRSAASGGSNRTKEELYNQAKRLKIEGRSRMTKAQLERAVSRADARS